MVSLNAARIWYTREYITTTDFNWAEFFPSMKLKSGYLDNYSGIGIDISVSSKWVIFQFLVNYPFNLKQELKNAIITPV